MFRNIFYFLFLLLLFILSGCIVTDALPTHQMATATTMANIPDNVPLTETKDSEPPQKTPVASPFPVHTPANNEVPMSTPDVPPLSVHISAEDEIARILSATLPPKRDDKRLAAAYRGLVDKDVSDRLANKPSPVEGAIQTFRILNVVDNTVGEINAELLAVGDHAYFWFDSGPGAPMPDQDELQNVVRKFDDIYENTIKYFGFESNPGIDGDSRLHVVNASPIALCGVTEETASQCHLAGLVQPADLLPSTVDPRSNEREMFVMNTFRFGRDSYLGVLAHEFRHMIEDNYDRADTDWEKEGSATLAAELSGYPSGGVERGNMFLENPDQQLNSWTENNTAPYYGQGYILNRFIFDKLGQELYTQFATSPLPGLLAVDSVAEANNLDFDGESLWLDWLVALAVHDDPRVPEKYRFEIQGLNRAGSTVISDVPADYQESVRQYAADYYELPIEARELFFSGDTKVSLLGTEPVSGERFWVAQRGNNSNPRLTRWIDLTDIEQATLSYSVYADIEYGYDFAYVSVSTDRGHTWIPLEGEHMQGLDPADNPAGSAFTERFYTGNSRQWVEEKIDLSPYAGQNIMLRFEYVTDPILTYGGLAIDDITIPEIGFFDDVESEDPDWVVEGFVRATASLPQNWHLQLITSNENVLVVEELMTNQEGELVISLDHRDATQRPILIVAATAPTTLEPANYELEIR